MPGFVASELCCEDRLGIIKLLEQLHQLSSYTMSA